MWPQIFQQVHVQDSFQSRFTRMSKRSPPRLLELAGRGLLREEALAVAALEELPTELFPPLFMAAFAGRRSRALTAMVRAWPFPCLPLGALMKKQETRRETLQAALDGLDGLLAQKVRPRRWKLRMLDLREDAHQDFWALWSGARPRARVLSLSEPGAAQPVPKRRKVDHSGMGAKQPGAPLEVLIDLCFKEAALDEFLTNLMEWVGQRKGSLHLCCRKLKIFAMPIQNLKKLLKMVQLHCIQEVDVSCTWKLPVLGCFAPHLGQMVNLHRLLLSHIRVPSRSSPAEEERHVAQFSSQILSLCHLQELYLNSVFFLKGRLDQVLGCLRSPLETLSITHCPLQESDLTHLSLCPNTSHLKRLDLSGVILLSMSPEPLKVLLEKVSVTLQNLDLEECGLTDSQLSVILPALGRCSRLKTFSFCGNSISMPALENLLRHTARLGRLHLGLYPAPLESYQELHGALHLGRLAELHARLKAMLRELGQSRTIWLSDHLCPQCGNRAFYVPEPIQCPCYTRA
ncbi:melanoma antigen preferentially expressed in tumors-like [Choloepus didactylus]|uniref:melanoma antigen preferentially expressed in tumors-like n=1 Tax=Choloepus didactylus TaxID=27675 RepID=UPI00189F52C7|nr:melanoma antigen preferentially expressed in tumors-like [Choloepus didactylus]